MVSDGQLGFTSWPVQTPSAPPGNSPSPPPPPASSCVFMLSDGEEHPGVAVRGAAVGRQLFPGDATQTLLPRSSSSSAAGPASRRLPAAPTNTPSLKITQNPQWLQRRFSLHPHRLTLCSTCPSKWNHFISSAIIFHLFSSCCFNKLKVWSFVFLFYSPSQVDTWEDRDHHSYQTQEWWLKTGNWQKTVVLIRWSVWWRWCGAPSSSDPLQWNQPTQTDNHWNFNLHEPTEASASCFRLCEISLETMLDDVGGSRGGGCLQSVCSECPLLGITFLWQRDRAASSCSVWHRS